jgi:hypothetical protein
MGSAAAGTWAVDDDFDPALHAALKRIRTTVRTTAAGVYGPIREAMRHEKRRRQRTRCVPWLDRYGSSCLHSGLELRGPRRTR